MIWITRAIGSALWMVVFLTPTLQAQEKPTAPLNAPNVTISAATPEDIQQRIHKLDLYIEAACKQWNVPGASVAVVHKDQVLLSKGYGVRKAGGDVSVDGDTLFAIASNSKAFTSAALAILVDEKKIRWDDRVQQHLPWFELYDEYVSHEVRISDLLCHRSGLGTFSGDLLWYGTPFTAESFNAVST
jgi:CubicO group peptidase (beta-lactamase class C family)